MGNLCALAFDGEENIEEVGRPRRSAPARFAKYFHVLKMLEGTKNKFVDKEFPATKESLITDWEEDDDEVRE